MKKYFLSSLLAIGFFACNKPVKGKNGVTYKSAVEYNDYIVNRQSTLIKDVVAFGQVAQSNLDSAEHLLRSFVTQAGTMIDELKGMPAYKGDSTLRDAAVSSFSFYKRVFETDYLNVLELKRKPDLTEEEQTRINDIVQKVAKEEEGYDSRFHDAQVSYAEKNNMKLTDNKLQNELNKLKNN